jgi:hypothetical protein
VSIACKGCPVTHHTHTHSVAHTHTTLRRYGTHTADKLTHCTFSMFSRGLVSDVRCFQKLPAIIWNQAALRTPPHIFLNKNNHEAVCHCGAHDTFFAGFHLCNLKNNYYCDTSLSNSSTILDREGLHCMAVHHCTYCIAIILYRQRPASDRSPTAFSEKR